MQVVAWWFDALGVELLSAIAVILVAVKGAIESLDWWRCMTLPRQLEYVDRAKHYSCLVFKIYYQNID